MRIAGNLTRDVREVRQVFRRMIFNVFAHNRDDHAKNHAFQMSSDGRWTTAPAYDLTCSVGPCGEHNLAVAGESRNPGEPEIMKVAAEASISPADARAVVEEVREAIGQWPEFAEAARLSRRRASEIGDIIDRWSPRARTGVQSTSPSG